MPGSDVSKWRWGTLLAVVLCATTAHATVDSFGLGTGRDGPLTVTSTGKVINAYAQVTTPLGPGTTTLSIGPVSGDGGFGAGQLVMVLQTTGLVPEPASGATGPLSVNGTVGRWELARLAAVSGNTLTLTASLTASYAANVSQVIRVPEYTDVTIGAGRSLATLPWNGSVGGVIAFLATGTVNNNGVINANAAGFRGGDYRADSSGTLGCTDLDEPGPSGAQKGEGLATTRWGSTGQGNVANGGGGGVCFQSGGGGGGNMGSGGNGGYSSAGDGSRAAGGLGGVALTSDGLIGRLVLGGGGGAGHGDDDGGVAGGRGGGAIFLRADQLTGTGFLSANGASGGVTPMAGGSGGGAGGSMQLYLAKTPGCLPVSVRGGTGGSSNSVQMGPGGGGGGGYVVVEAPDNPFNPSNTSCLFGIQGAASGVQTDPSAPAGASYGARPGAIGGAFHTFSPPPPPVVVTPPDGALLANPRPHVAGTAEPGNTLTVILDEAPVGNTTADAAGNWSFTPPADLSEGTHTVKATAAKASGGSSLESAPHTFTLDITPPDTFISSGPPNPSASASATFDFDSEPGSSYECRLDSEPAFASCTDPVTFTGLGEGNHLLEVRARDAAGNVDPTPASSTWRIELVSELPGPTITMPENGTRLLDKSPTYAGTASAGLEVIVMREDGSVVCTATADIMDSWSCVEPTTLADGPHTVLAVSGNASGPVGAPARTTFTVATLVTPPVGGSGGGGPDTGGEGNEPPGAPGDLFVYGGGCSSSGGTPPPWLVALLLTVPWLRSRRTRPTARGSARMAGAGWPGDSTQQDRPARLQAMSFISPRGQAPLRPASCRPCPPRAAAADCPGRHEARRSPRHPSRRG